MSDKKQEQSFGWVEDFRREQLKKSARNPGLAAIFSFFVMGMGQIYAGHIDRGVIFMVINAFSLIAGYSVYTSGLVYNWLMSLTGENGIMILSYVASVIYILIWIYNIKDAYYLSIFSSFRDWFEVERVLLPSMGVPSDLLLSSTNSNPLGMIENKSCVKNAAAPVAQQQVELKSEPVQESEGDKEDDNVINITVDSEKKETEVTTASEIFQKSETEKEIETDNTIKYRQEEDDLSDSEAAGLVYMNYSSWKLFGAAFLVLVGAGAGIYYFNSDYSKESSLQLVKDFAVADKNKVVATDVAVIQTEQPKVASEEIHHATTIVNNSKQPVDAYPILMTQSQIDSYVDWRMNTLLAAREKRKRYETIYSEDDSEEIPLIVSSDINDEADEEKTGSNEVIFVQGHKEAKILKKTSNEDLPDNSSNTLYVAPDDNTENDDDVQLIMTDESGSTELQEPVTEKDKVVVPNVDSIVLDCLNHEKETEKTKELNEKNYNNEVQNVENVDDKTSEVDNKKEEKNNLTPVAETPEIRAALERIKERGAYEFYRGNWEGALPFYFELLKYRRNAEAFEMVGIIFEKMNKLTDAYDAYENAYKLGMNSRNNVTRLGLIGEKLGRYQEAQKYLEMAIEKSPKRADIILSYARCLDKQGESMAAAQVLAVLRDSTSSYAIKQAAEQGYQDILKARQKQKAAQEEVEKAVTNAIKNKK